jgi:hypothetical protein
MISKARQIGMFLLPGMILAIAAIYVFPIQQAMACGGGCDGGGKKGGGSLVNVQGNNIGNVKDNNIKVANVKTGDNNIKVGNVKTGDVLSANKIKFLNDNDQNEIASHILKYNEVLSDNGEVASHILKYNEVLSDFEGNNVPILNDNTLNAFKLLGCGC